VWHRGLGNGDRRWSHVYQSTPKSFEDQIVAIGSGSTDWLDNVHDFKERRQKTEKLIIIWTKRQCNTVYKSYDHRPSNCDISISTMLNFQKCFTRVSNGSATNKDDTRCRLTRNFTSMLATLR
jgi:hypothetical protein